LVSSDVRQMERSGLDPISRSGVQLTACNRAWTVGSGKYLFLVDRWTQDLLLGPAVCTNFAASIMLKMMLRPCGIGHWISAPKPQSRFLQDFPPVSFANGGCFKLRRKAAFRL